MKKRDYQKLLEICLLICNKHYDEPVGRTAVQAAQKVIAEDANAERSES